MSLLDFKNFLGPELVLDLFNFSVPRFVNFAGPVLGSRPGLTGFELYLGHVKWTLESFTVFYNKILNL